MESSKSAPIDKFIKFAKYKIDAKIFEELMAAGMCQGIFQDNSSKVHGILSLAKIDTLKHLFPYVTNKYLVTSDDSEGVTHIPRGMDRVETIKAVHCIGLRLGNLFNIVRSGPKSAFNFRIAELNSIFFSKGEMATPSIKQRIAKIDVGAGVNHIEDFLSVQAAAASYLASGGSYMGATILTILNFVLHTEQWLRWGFVKSDMYYRPVEFGGFPVIEPISAIISGGVSNMYQRVSDSVSAEKYSRLVVNSLLCPPETVSLEEFSRSGSERVKKTYSDNNVSIVRGAGPLGVFQMVRTDRKLSQFERKHGIRDWVIPESCATLLRDSPIASEFIFSIFRSTSVTTLETNVGINSFYIRMAEPWASFGRKCMRVSEQSPFAKVLSPNGDMLSHSEFYSKIESLTAAESTYELILAARSCVRKPQFEIMETQLTVRLNDSKSIKDYLSSQEAEDFKRSKVSPSIQTITLRGHSAADSDLYLLTILKTMSGSKSKDLINKYKRSLHAYDNITVAVPDNPIDLLTSVVLADGALALYSKFIRKSTKMTIPNKVDDLRALCVDIISNKFTEGFGMVVAGTLNLDPERAKPYAHSNWYQKLMEESQTYEDWLADAILSNKSINPPKVAISSVRPLITRHDMFEFAPTTAPEKTVLVDCKSKDAFVNTLRTWSAAKVKFILSRDTIESLLAGRLTFAHDYYAGDNRFYRYAKTKYLTIKAGSATGMHMIQTKVTESKGKRRTSYRHTLLFAEDVSGRRLEASLSSPDSAEDWTKELSKYISSINNTRVDHWYKIPDRTVSNPVSFRKTRKEDDFVVIRTIKPGTDFELTNNKGSFCFFLDNGTVSLPITYINPQNINNLDIGFTIDNNMMVTATKCYVELRKITKNFSKSIISNWAKLESAFNFILVGSSTDTPDDMINNILEEFVKTKINANILDVIRTFLINNQRIGLGYSSSRFSQHLLNLGTRRSHNHNFLCRTISGARADADSEDWDNESAAEDLIVVGQSNPAEFVDLAEEEDVEIPEYLRVVGGSSHGSWGDVGELATDLATGAVESWAEQVIDNVEQSTPLDPLEVVTVGEFNPWDSDDDSASGVSNKVEEAEDDTQAGIDNANSSNQLSNEITLPTTGASAESTPAVNPYAAKMNSMLQGMTYDFDQSTEDSDGSSVAGIDVVGIRPKTLDEMFTLALKGSYDKVHDHKDMGLKSERTGHTVSPSLESAKAFIDFILKWLKTAGSATEFDDNSSLPKDVSGISGLYLTMHESGVLGLVNPLEKFYGMDKMTLPVCMSALAIVSTVYNVS